MAVTNKAANTPRYAQLLAVVLATATILVFSVGRVLLQGYNLPDGTAEVVMIGIIVTTIGGGLTAAYRNDGVTTGAMIALGSPVGLAVYLLVVIALEGPSSDSPTWLLYLMITGFFLVIGAIGYGIGSIARQLS